MAMRVFDVFPFFNELDLLEIRLNTLNEFVDEFIITEADKTFSGLDKPYFASQAVDRFKQFAHKITIQRVTDIPMSLNPFERDCFQRDQVREILRKKMSGEDLLIYGDVDEIPNPQTLEIAIRNHMNPQIFFMHFAQDVYYCYFNQKETSGTFLSYTGEYNFIFKKKWLGTNISKWSYSQNFAPSDLRDPKHKKNGVRLKNGGWHFSYIGSEGIISTKERVEKKIKSAAHQEFNQPNFLNNLSENIVNSRDIFSRKRSRYVVLSDLSYLPAYILNNLANYENLIKEIK